MNTVGIVTEYNPFHLGHRYQIETLRREGAQRIVAVMSGNFTQRAEPAILPKFARARAATQCGVDLMIELPVAYAVASAEDFARGGIGLLAATGIVDTVCCGCESSDEVNRAQFEALITAEKSGEIRRKMKEGLSYPAACRNAVRAAGGYWSDQPNDLLALTYRKALSRIPNAPHLHTLRRVGSYHGADENGFAGAEAIREKLRNGEDISALVPPESARILSEEPHCDPKKLEPSLLAFCRTLTPETANRFYGFREGIAARVIAASGEKSIPDLCLAAKTKRYPLSAIRRAVLCGYLGIPNRLPPLSYLRVLAFNDTGRTMLKEMKQTATLPICTALSPAMIDDPSVRIQLDADEKYAVLFDPPLPRRCDFTVRAHYPKQYKPSPDSDGNSTQF